MDNYRKVRRVDLDIPKEAYVAIQALVEEAKPYGLLPLSPSYTTRDFILERLGDGVMVFQKRLQQAKAPSIILP